MAVIEIDVAQGALNDALAAVERGDEVVLVRDGQPVAWMVPAMPHVAWKAADPRAAGSLPDGSAGAPPDRVPGSARGLVIIRDDFDDPLEDFRNYI